ncbi:hypothetical protein [Xanthobacter variabilis]|uniref:hypothetical protein n=1 Tax=Xanthobacter variabilis TaxID=3119932 RepID=UPI00374E387A
MNDQAEGWGDEFVAMVRTFEHFGAKFPHVTEEAVEKALEGFPAPLAEGRDMGTLATAIRSFLGLLVRRPEDDPYACQGNAQTRDNLYALAERAEELWEDLAEIPWAEWSAIHTHGLERHRLGISGGRDDELNYMLAIKHIFWLSGFLAGAALRMDSGDNVQPPRWRERAQRERRIERGTVMAHVFKEAFAQPVTVNNWPSGKDTGPTLFMDFYRRIVTLALNGQEADTDISGVLRAARDRDAEREQKYWASRHRRPEGVAPLSSYSPEFRAPRDD